MEIAADRRTRVVALAVPFRDECELWQNVLHDAGLVTELLPDEPQQGFARVRARHPDLVVGRIHPARHGIELLSAIRRDPRTRDIPVLLLTSYPLPALHAEARDAGADEVVLLPMLPEDLAALAWTLVRAGHRA